jgi:hypothetical protein
MFVPRGVVNIILGERSSISARDTNSYRQSIQTVATEHPVV